MHSISEILAIMILGMGAGVRKCHFFLKKTQIRALFNQKSMIERDEFLKKNVRETNNFHDYNTPGAAREHLT